MGVVNQHANQQHAWMRAAFYCLINIMASVCIVFANKLVLTYYGFKFVFLLTWIHTAFTIVGMHGLASLNFFTPKKLPPLKIIPLALGFVGYVVLSNMSLSMNSVGLYQILKIGTAPTVVLLEFILYKHVPSKLMLCSVVVVSAGTDTKAGACPWDSYYYAGVLEHAVEKYAVSLLQCICISNKLMLCSVLVMRVLEQVDVWASSKQRELDANSSQLLTAYAPHALWLLGIMVPIFEPIGWGTAAPGTLLGYTWTVEAALAISLSAFLGFLISLSTFLVIGAT
ncbi:hypothetical protein DUNSADRAFT_11006, partial [Dunaliella salina]